MVYHSTVSINGFYCYHRVARFDTEKNANFSTADEMVIVSNDSSANENLVNLQNK